MWFIDNIVTYCNNISSFFYQLYLEVLGWIAPFYYVAGFFYAFSTLFSDMAWGFYYFGQWVDTTASKLLEILSYANIASYFAYYFDIAVSAWNWVGNAWSWFQNEVAIWWGNTSLTVQSWIDFLKWELSSLITQLDTWLTTLQAVWDNFWTTILPNLADWSGVDTLIASWFTNFTPFWEGWLDWKDSLIEFIQDPWQWLYDRVEDLFDRFW